MPRSRRYSSRWSRWSPANSICSGGALGNPARLDLFGGKLSESMVTKSPKSPFADVLKSAIPMRTVKPDLQAKLAEVFTPWTLEVARLDLFGGKLAQTFRPLIDSHAAAIAQMSKPMESVVTGQLDLFRGALENPASFDLVGVKLAEAFKDELADDALDAWLDEVELGSEVRSPAFTRNQARFIAASILVIASAWVVWLNITHPSLFDMVMNDAFPLMLMWGYFPALVKALRSGRQ